MPNQTNPPLLTRASLTADLYALGLQAGDMLMVHASLRRIGPIAGGADTLLDALSDVLGPKGTLIMPFGSNDDEPFDKLTSAAETDIGILAERFRQRPGTLVNDHVAARFGAVGAHALAILEPVPLHDYYGRGSPLERFTTMGGQVLRLGANTDTVTVTHWAEYVANIPHKRRVRRHYVRADTGEQWIESLDDSDGIAVWPKGDYFPQILVDFLDTGHARHGRVGGCTAELFPAAPFVNFAVAWLEANLSA